MFPPCRGVTVRALDVILVSSARIQPQLDAPVGPHIYRNFPVGVVVPSVAENEDPSPTDIVWVVPRVKSSGGGNVTLVSTFDNPVRKSIRLSVDEGIIGATASSGTGLKRAA